MGMPSSSPAGLVEKTPPPADEATMNPYRAYQDSNTLPATRIDMLLALFDRAILRLDQPRQVGIERLIH